MTPVMTFGTGAVTRSDATIDGMRTRRTLAVLLAGLTAAAAVGAVRASAATDAAYPAARPALQAPPPHPGPDPRPTVAVLLGPAGANAADVLGPFETLAASGRYHVVTVAATRDPVPLTGGLDLVPDHTFADLGPAAWIVVPEVQQAGSDRLRPAVDWLRQRYAAGTNILSVCAGAALLARTGLLTGRPATSSWLGLYGLEHTHPDVRWRRGTRYVDDGRIISTAAVLSGIDGALRILEREHGPGAARQAADAVRWPAYHPGGPAPIPAASPGPADTVALLNAGFRRPARTEVLLTPGVGEIELASVFRTYTQLSYAARLTSATLDGQPVRSRHGLTFVPRATAGTGFDRLLVPGLAAPRVDASWHPVYVHDRAEFPFQSTLRDLAATTDRPTARWVAKTLEYSPGPLSGPSVPWLPALLLLVVAAAGAVAYGLLLSFLDRRPRVRHWLRHLVEMVVAMGAGMVVAGTAGHGTVVMVAGMTVGMALWMAVRGHGPRMIAEMTVVMVAPFVVLFPWPGAAHAVMLAGMLGVMLVRQGHYSAAPGWAFPRRRVLAPVVAVA